MRREPSSSRPKTNSSSPGSICSRRRGFPAENIPGVEVAGRRRKGPADRKCHRRYRSCSCRRNSRSWSRSCRCRCNCCRRYSCRNRGSRVNHDWNSRGSRGCDNFANHGCANRDWNSCGNRYSNSLAAAGNLNLELADNWNSGLVDRRSRVGRQRGPGWLRRQGPGSAQRPVASGQCCLGLIYLHPANEKEKAARVRTDANLLVWRIVIFLPGCRWFHSEILKEIC